jgi:hypothetical protein
VITLNIPSHIYFCLSHLWDYEISPHYRKQCPNKTFMSTQPRPQPLQLIRTIQADGERSPQEQSCLAAYRNLHVAFLTTGVTNASICLLLVYNIPHTTRYESLAVTCTALSRSRPLILNITGLSMSNLRHITLVHCFGCHSDLVFKEEGIQTRANITYYASPLLQSRQKFVRWAFLSSR